ncbi:MAG: hypothetical protein WD069_11080 [Planctomycetales bacterium]
MASSKSTVTAVHFSLMFFVMATIILGVTTYLGYKERGEAYAAAATAKADADAKKKVSTLYQEQIRALAERIGHLYDEVGENDRANLNTIIGRMEADLRQYGPAGAEFTFSAALLGLRSELDKAIAANNALTANDNDLKNELTALRAQYQGVVDQHQAAKDVALDGQKKLMESKAEEVKDKIAEINQLTAANDALKTEREQLIKTHTAQIAEKNEVIENYIARLNIVLEKLDRVTMVSFERPDGLVRRIDNTTGLVWINLGSDDYLPLRTSFSVYRKAHHGIGRGQEDIKGAIEVTRIVGPNLAEARILRNSLGDPIAPDDPIYTPLWTPGRTEKIAFVGFLDIDGDGHSDRDAVHNLVAAAGADVVSEVDDQGVRTGGKLDVETRFLVVGQIKAGNQDDPAEVKRFDEVSRNHKDMVEEARQHGVRVISLHDFLAYVGYTPRSRTWRPGEPRPNTLKSGAASTAVNETIGDRSSAGQTSGVYGRRGQTEQPVSSGQTSKVFGGGRGN